VLSLVNLHPHESVPLSISTSGFQAREVSGRILTAVATDAHNSFDAPKAIEPAEFTGASMQNGVLNVTLPSKSVVVLSLR
jgi:alpha-N-arabinofuranosidase